MIRIVPLLSCIPIPPIFKISDLRDDIPFTFGDHLNTPQRARTLLEQANILVAAATTEGSRRSKMQIREGALLRFGSTSGEMNAKYRKFASATGGSVLGQAGLVRQVRGKIQLPGLGRCCHEENRQSAPMETQAFRLGLRAYAPEGKKQSYYQ